MLEGKAEPMIVHELLGNLDGADEKQKKSCEIFADAALAAFRRRSWNEAEQKFKESFQVSPTDGPAHFYLKSVHAIQSEPSP